MSDVNPRQYLKCGKCSETLGRYRIPKRKFPPKITWEEDVDIKEYMLHDDGDAYHVLVVHRFCPEDDPEKFPTSHLFAIMRFLV
jgi:hypothetical protein